MCAERRRQPPRGQSRPVTVAMSTSLPAASASVHHIGRPVADHVAAGGECRCDACLGLAPCGTPDARCGSLRRLPRSSPISSNQKAGPRRAGPPGPPPGCPAAARSRGRHARTAAPRRCCGHRGRPGGSARRAGRRQTLLAGSRRDLAGQLHVRGRTCRSSRRSGQQPDRDAVLAQVDVRRVVVDARKLADRLDEPHARRDEPVRKKAQAPSLRTRQSCAPAPREMPLP